ncbi:MAG: hypothetical protein QG620_644 [Patescibacteria group bacterium]|nr:hypothetical protein [Patescibacteria group bacterium]
MTEIDIKGLTVDYSAVEKAAKVKSDRAKEEAKAIEKLQSGISGEMAEGLCLLGEIKNISPKTLVRLAYLKLKLEEAGHTQVAQNIGHVCKRPT